MKKLFILNFLLLLITLTSISTQGMWISRLRQSSSYIRPQYVPTSQQQRTYAQPRRTKKEWTKSWGSGTQQTQWQQPEYQNFQNANQGRQTTGQTWGEWFKSKWYGTTSYGPTSIAFKNFIALLPEGTTEENWKEKFSEFTKANHPDRVNALVVSKTISPAEGNARIADYTKIITYYNEWKREKLKANE